MGRDWGTRGLWDGEKKEINHYPRIMDNLDGITNATAFSLLHTSYFILTAARTIRWHTCHALVLRRISLLASERI